VAGSYDYDNEPSVPIKCGEFLDWLRTGQLLRKDCVPRRRFVGWLVS